MLSAIQQRFWETEQSQIVELRKELVLWLAMYPWDYFVTLTYKPRVVDGQTVFPAPDTCFKRAKKLCRTWGVSRAIFVAERFHTSSGTHLHGFVWWDLDKPPLSQDIWRWWFDKYGINRIVPYKSGLAPALYLTKYVTKGFIPDYYLYWGKHCYWKNIPENLKKLDFEQQEADK